MGKLLLFILSVAGLGFHNAFERKFQWLDAPVAESAIPGLVKEALMGPLKGKMVVLVLPVDQDKDFFIGENITREIRFPVYLIRLPRRIPPMIEKYVQGPNNTNKQHTDVQYLNGDGEPVNFPEGTGIVLIVTPREETPWWPLRYPPFNWSSNVILVVSPTLSCWRTPLLQTPLLHITTWVAVICPSKPQGKNNSNLSFKVWTWLPFAAGEKLVDLGPWNPGYIRSWDQLFIDRFYDMSENTITVIGNPVDWPFYYQKDNGEDAGQTLRIAEFTSLRHNAKFKVRGEKDSDYFISEDLIRKGEVDALINVITATPERYRDFQVSIPYAYESFAVVLEEPPPLPRWQNILYPFTKLVWYSTVASIIATSVTFHILYYRHETSFITNTITISQSILANALAKVPEGWNIRWFLLMWWIAGWILRLSYTCNLIAILTVPVYPKRIQSLEELADSDYRLCMLDYGEFVQEALLTSTQKDFATLGRKLDMVPVREDLPNAGEEACVEKVLAGTHAHVETMPFVELLYKKLGLGLKSYVLEERIYPSFFTIILYKYDLWKYKLDIDIQLLMESGVARKWLDEIMNDLLRSKPKSGSGIRLLSLSLGHLQGPFLLLFLGCFTGLLVMGAEAIFPSSL